MAARGGRRDDELPLVAELQDEQAEHSGEQRPRTPSRQRIDRPPGGEHAEPGKEQRQRIEQPKRIEAYPGSDHDTAQCADQRHQPAGQRDADRQQHGPGKALAQSGAQQLRAVARLNNRGQQQCGEKGFHPCRR